MDATDLAILRLLMQDGRATWADLAVAVGLTAPAIAQRVRRLQDRGIIRHFGVWLETDALVPVSAFVAVSVAPPAAHVAFQRAVGDLEAVQECHHVSGDDQYLLKVRCASFAELADLVSEVLPRMTGGDRVSSRVILRTVKESPLLPLSSLETTNPEGGSRV